MVDWYEAMRWWPTEGDQLGEVLQELIKGVPSYSPQALDGRLGPDAPDDNEGDPSLGKKFQQGQWYAHLVPPCSFHGLGSSFIMFNGCACVAGALRCCVRA